MPFFILHLQELVDVGRKNIESGMGRNGVIDALPEEEGETSGSIGYPLISFKTTDVVIGHLTKNLITSISREGNVPDGGFINGKGWHGDGCFV